MLLFEQGYRWDRDRVVTLVATARTMSFRYELACKGHSTEKAQNLVT